MNESQKIIKYGAIALAIFLIVSIVSSLLFILANIFNYSYPVNSNELYDTNISNNIEKIDIELSTSKLNIESSSKFSIETNSKNIKINDSRGKLEIKETGWFNNIGNEVTIYIPDSMIFREVDIESGSGNLNINKLKTDILELDLGAGSINIDNLVVNNKTDIDTGAGSVIINSSVLNNLDLHLGSIKT